MPTLTAPSTVSFPLQIDQILTLTTNFGTGNVTLSAQKSGDIVYSYNSEQMQDAPVFSPGSQGIVTITHLTGSLTYNVTTSAFPLFENTPRVLFQSAIPFILAGGTATNQFTVNSAGLVTALPTLPITSGFAFVYMPSGVTGTAGWYYAQVLSATSVQLYTARYTSDDPKLAVPTVLVAQSTTANNYSQTNGNINAVQVTIPGGSMGPNGSIEGVASWLPNASANTKTLGITFDNQPTPVWQQTSTTVVTRYDNRFALANVNSQLAQAVVSASFSGGFSGVAIGDVAYTSNTATDRVMAFQMQLNTVGADFLILRYGRLDLRYGA